MILPSPFCRSYLQVIQFIASNQLEMNNPESSGSSYTQGAISITSQALNDDDRLQTSQEQLEIALAKARTYWHSLADKLCHKRYTLIIFNLQPMLNRVPAIPREPERIRTYSTSPTQKAMFIEASST